MRWLRSQCCLDNSSFAKTLPFLHVPFFLSEKKSLEANIMKKKPLPWVWCSSSPEFSFHWHMVKKLYISVHMLIIFSFFDRFSSNFKTQFLKFNVIKTNIMCVTLRLFIIFRGKCNLQRLISTINLLQHTREFKDCACN